MPSGDNAVKGKQGFQTTERPAAEIGSVDVAGALPVAPYRTGPTAEDPEFQSAVEAIAELGALRSRITRYEQHLVRNAFARKVRSLSPDVSRVRLFTRDGDFGRFVTFADAEDADGNSVEAPWGKDYLSTGQDSPLTLLMSLDVDGEDVLDWDDEDGEPYIDIQAALDDDPDQYRP